MFIYIYIYILFFQIVFGKILTFLVLKFFL